jgi:DNA-binding beta-propeller fold protein YncE
VRFNSEGAFVQEWGGRGSAPGQLLQPTGIAIGADGNILVADAGNQRIQKFTPDGALLDMWSSEAQTVGERATPVAVQRAPDEGVIATGLLIAAAPDGTIYVANDGSEPRVQRFRPDGTFLGDWSWGGPRAMAVDTAGNVYVTSGSIGSVRGTPRVRVFSPMGELLREWDVADRPSGIAVDGQGNVYVDYQRGLLDAPLQKFDGQGRLLTSWGGPNRAPGEMDEPRGIAADATGNVYVADLGTHRVQRFNSTGDFVVEWTGASLGLGRELQPYDVAVGPRGDIFVLDDLSTVVQVNRDGRRVQEWYATDGAPAFHLDVDPLGRVYAAGDIIWVSSPDGEVVNSWPIVAEGIQYPAPWSIAIDVAGHVYVSDLRSNVVSKLTTDGRLLATWRGEGVGPAEGFYEPLELAVDAAGNVYVAGYRLVQKLSGDGELLAAWETAGPQEPGLALPSGVAVDGDGHVYVVEQYNNLAKQFAQRGQRL